MEAERKRARDWYRWLWLSPLLTIPTLIFIFFVDIGYNVICGPGHCDWDLAHQVNLLLSILLSSLWHLVLLKPVSDKLSPFVHWHGLQALCLAGLRTAVPLAAVIFFGDEFSLLFTIPILILIWLIGTFISEQEAARGKCSLAQLAGRGEELACYKDLKLKSRPEQKKIRPGDVEEWVNIVRLSKDTEKRRQALVELKRLDMVEDF